MELITERYGKNIAGELSCFDRLLIVGTLPKVCFAAGMTALLYSQKVKIFDYPKWAMEFTGHVRANSEAISKASGVGFEFVRSHNARKEDLVEAVLERRGRHPGLVHILTAMEGCQTYKPWHDKGTHRTSLKPETGKCLHYYFYFIDEELGLFHVRVPTYAPFKLQVCLNGHNWLARLLDKAGIGYAMSDNAFLRIDDWAAAQALADTLPVERLHRIMDSYVKVLVPEGCMFGQQYHWSIQQAELSHDVVFKRQDTLKPIYGGLVATAIHVVKPENIATFLGRKLSPNFQGEAGNRYNIRIEGSRISHRMGCNSIKMYDKHGQILRIETTTNDISFFQHHRTVEHKDGSTTMKFANMRKTIYSLGALRECMAASNRRYLEFISQIEDRSHGQRRLERLTESVEENGRKYKGFNIFDKDDERTLMAAIRGEFNIYGFRSRDLAKHIPEKSPSQITRILKRLKLHKLIKRAGKTFKYYLTTLGKAVILNAQKIKEMVLIPQLSY
jgi:hypothetical protein